jgi:hypothetical protein
MSALKIRVLGARLAPALAATPEFNEPKEL